MKTKYTIFLLVMSLISINLSGCTDDKVIPENELPAAIKVYLSTHFQNNPVLQATVDKEIFSSSYEVILKDNFKLEFDSKNEIKRIEAKSKLPDSVIPATILEYVRINYSSNVIIEWELGKNKQEVKLDNKLELVFNKDGVFLRLDD